MVDDLTLLHARHIPRCLATVDKVFRYHTLQLMMRGTVELFYDDVRYEMRGYWFWPCFPGPRIRFHEFPCGVPWEHRYVAFTGPLVSRWEAWGLLLHTPLAVTAGEARWLMTRYDELLEQMNRPGRWGIARAINLLEAILLKLAEQSLTSRSRQPIWLGAVQSELERFDQPPNYKTLAAAQHVSLTSLRRQFREATGTSLHQYHLDWVVVEARRRLGNTDQPIKQIAEELGYQDVYYFTRQFTQLTGISPARYRRSRQE